MIRTQLVQFPFIMPLKPSVLAMCFKPCTRQTLLTLMQSGSEASSENILPDTPSSMSGLLDTHDVHISSERQGSKNFVGSRGKAPAIHQCRFSGCLELASISSAFLMGLQLFLTCERDTGELNMNIIVCSASWHGACRTPIAKLEELNVQWTSMTRIKIDATMAVR